MINWVIKIDTITGLLLFSYNCILLVCNAFKSQCKKIITDIKIPLFIIKKLINEWLQNLFRKYKKKFTGPRLLYTYISWSYNQISPQALQLCWFLKELLVCNWSNEFSAFNYFIWIHFIMWWFFLGWYAVEFFF